jgi:hypothetical protein
MAKAVCAEISSEIVKVVPQLDDYLCPVCFTVSYKPIRLKCNHVFCIRCMIKMQQSKTKFCPLCRNNVVLDADSGEWPSSSCVVLLPYHIRKSTIGCFLVLRALLTLRSEPRHFTYELPAGVFSQGDQGQAKGERSCYCYRSVGRGLRQC